MSWDISIQDMPLDAKSVSDIPHDFRPNPLGSRAEVITRIREIFSQADFSDPSWGLFDVAGFSIEFNMGRKEICDGFMLHVRGGSNAVAAISHLLQHLQLRAFDCQTGDFFSSDAGQESFEQWQDFRDRAVKKAQPDGTDPSTSSG